MTISKFLPVLGLAVTAMCAGCVSRTTAPPLQGPSTLGLSLILAATPDVLSMDGASQSRITIDARDANGQPIPNQQVRAEIVANGQPVDFGSINARTTVTGSNGEAVIVYTAPTAVPGAPIPTLAIVINPAGTDTNAQFDTSRFVAIKLVPPGVITGSGPTAAFTFSPASPVAFTSVTFDASTSAPPPVGVIASYAWDFGDGSKATGTPAIHQFTSVGTFNVVLTVTDSIGAVSTKSQLVTVIAGVQPIANFTVVPSPPINTNQNAFFDGSTSSAGPGRKLVSWNWDFGPGSARQSGVSVTKSWDVAATYLVTLTVTDDVGQTGIKQSEVTVMTPAGTSSAVAQFTISANPAAVNQSITFDATPSTVTAPATIQQYQWNFNDGTPLQTTYAPTKMIVHAFTTTGVKTVTLTLVDSNGASSPSVSHTVTVQ